MTPTKSRKADDERSAEQVYSIALHDVRRMIETMRADEKLVAYIYKRLSRAVAEVHHLPELVEYAMGASGLMEALGDGPADT
jgi:hypothetical protein